MGLFSSKKKQEDNTPNEATEPVKKKAGKKKKGGMSSVFKEAVFEAILDDFVTNTQFAMERDGEPVYVGMLLDINAIGGFSKKSNKDEAKGSIIECINSSRIKTLITAELMEEECIIFIPDEFTLAAMDEFSLLTDASYTAVYVHPDGEIEKTDIPMSYTDARNVVTHAVSIQEFMGADDELTLSQEFEDDEIDNDSEEDNMSYDEPDDVSYGSDEPDYEDNSYEDTPQSDFDPYAYDDADATGVPEDEYGEYAEDDSAYEPEPEQEEVLETVPEDDVWKTIQRKFYSDDLQLEVSTEPFDAQFLHGNAYIPFDENRGEGWLNEYLNQMSRDANVELQHLHQKNLMDARRKYCTLLSMYCDKISKDLDTVDPESRFGVTLQALKQSKANALGGMDRVVSERKDEINKKWEQTLEQIGEDAKSAAQRQYRERYGRQHDADVMNIEFDVKDRIESEYNEALHAMHEDRRKEASKMLDIGVNSVLNAVSNIYLKSLKQESDRYNEIKRSMEKFIDNNRKNDIAYAETLHEQLMQSQEADRVRDELTAKIEHMSAEFEAKKLSLRADLENMQRQNNERLREKDIVCDDKIREIQERNIELQKQLDDLLKKYAELDIKKDSEYQSRINTLENQNEALREECKHVANVNKNANKISILLAVVAIITAASIGFIIGMNSKLNSDKAEEQSAVIEEFNKAKEEIDNEAEDDATSNAIDSNAIQQTVPTTVAPTDNTVAPSVDATNVPTVDTTVPEQQVVPDGSTTTVIDPVVPAE